MSARPAKSKVAAKSATPKKQVVKKAAPAKKKEPTVDDFLGEHPEFERIDNGRIKCNTTGHEMLADLPTLEHHLKSKSYKKATWYKADIGKYEEHFIVPHKKNPKLMYCELTRATLNRIPEQLDMYLNSAAFKRALLAKKKRDDLEALKAAKREEAKQARIKAAIARREASKAANGSADGEDEDEDNEELEDSGYEDEDEEMEEIDGESEPVSGDEDDEMEDEEDEEEEEAPKVLNKITPVRQNGKAKQAKPVQVQDDSDEEEAEQFSEGGDDSDDAVDYLDESEEGMPIYRKVPLSKALAAQKAKAPAAKAKVVKKAPKAAPKAASRPMSAAPTKKRPMSGKPSQASKKTKK